MNTKLATFSDPLWEDPQLIGEVKDYESGGLILTAWPILYVGVGYIWPETHDLQFSALTFHLMQDFPCCFPMRMIVA